MKRSPVKIILLALLIIGIVGAVQAIWFSHGEGDGRRLVEKTRQELRQQGFKTDLADFDFTTSAELRRRESALTAYNPGTAPNPFHDHPNLMDPVGTNSAIVVWKQDWPRTEEDQILWPVLRQAMEENRFALDAAGEAAMSGPIRFELEARGGSGMLLRHLAPMKNLTQSLGSRAVLELHDGNRSAAWTNLLAETRLVTAWEPEPAEVSHLVRFSCAALAYAATWQVLQCQEWTDDQLAQLQMEWEAPNFFTNLPETAAFKRASMTAMCEQIQKEPLDFSGRSITELAKGLVESPRSTWSDISFMWSEARYRKYVVFVDEKNLLLYFQKREIEIRNAMQSPDWLQMRALPGVTNPAPFTSKYRSRIQAMLNTREIGMTILKGRTSLLGRAAETEARRRILLTTIALERYHARHGAYPKSLTALTPEFLKVGPVDFMDGRPLRYRLTDDGHFILYSVGLDCVDDGGEMPPHEQPGRYSRGRAGRMATAEKDIVWPRPASAEEIEAVLQQEKFEREQEWAGEEETQTVEQWNQSDQRQAAVTNLLAMKYESITNEPDFQGRKLGDVLRNETTTGTNRLRLDELLTLKQVITGEEPETITFELPVNFDALPDASCLRLLLDTVEFSDAEVQECKRATNGNCLLVWHAIFETPGQHGLRVAFTGEPAAGPGYGVPPPPRISGMMSEPLITGPVLPFTNSNLCQFSLSSATYDEERGAIFHCRLPESNGTYTIECTTTNGAHLKTVTGSTRNGVFKVVWDLISDSGYRLGGETFSETIKVTLPDSGRSQNVRGP